MDDAWQPLVVLLLAVALGETAVVLAWEVEVRCTDVELTGVLLADGTANRLKAVYPESATMSKKLPAASIQLPAL